MLKFEIVYKFCLVCALILGLSLLAFSGLNFALGRCINLQDFWLRLQPFCM